jgi:hypothetical protein
VEVAVDLATEGWGLAFRASGQDVAAFDEHGSVLPPPRNLGGSCLFSSICGWCGDPESWKERC